MPSPLVPDISAGLRGFEFGRNIQRQGQADERQAQDRALALQSIQAGNIASEANSMLQFDSPELLRANLIRRAQEVTRNPVEGLKAEDFIDMANRLGDENGFANIQAELKSDLARAQEITTPQAANVQFGAQSTFKDEEGNLFFGTTKRNPNTGAVESVLAPVGGGNAEPVGQVQQTGGFGQTGQERVTQKGEEAKAIAVGKGTGETQTPLGEIKLDTANIEQVEKARDLSAQKAAVISDATAAINNINTLLQGGTYKSIYGAIEGRTPTVSQKSLDAEALRNQIVGLLALENRQKLKGQGTITDVEVKQLEQSASTLANPTISDGAAKKELLRVRKIFRSAKKRADAGKLTKPSEDTGQPVDRQIGRFSIKRVN